jgi:hypothetical protein
MQETDEGRFRKLAISGLVAMFAVTHLLSVAVGGILDGWVLSILWGWFMVPVFHLPPLTIVPAIGIALTIGFLIKKAPRSVGEEKASRPNVGKMDQEQWGFLAKNLVLPWLSPFITLFFGWVVHLFM